MKWIKHQQIFLQMLVINALINQKICFPSTNSNNTNMHELKS